MEKIHIKFQAIIAMKKKKKYFKSSCADITHCNLETPNRVANSADPDQKPLNVASDQGLHCLQMAEPFFSQNI